MERRAGEWMGCHVWPTHSPRFPYTSLRDEPPMLPALAQPGEPATSSPTSPTKVRNPEMT